MGVISKILELFSGGKAKGTSHQQKESELLGGVGSESSAESNPGVGSRDQQSEGLVKKDSEKTSESDELDGSGEDPDSKSEDNSLERSDQVTILVVDDEEEVADIYAAWLKNGKSGEVKTAYGGEEALEMIDEDVDIVFLDRRMPDMSGDRVLRKIREQGIDCQVSMVTAVDPDFDIVDMEFDHYITKPVDEGDFKQATNKLIERMELDEETQEKQTLGLKKTILEDNQTEEEMEDNEDYDRLLGEMEEKNVDNDVDEDLGDFFSR